MVVVEHSPGAGTWVSGVGSPAESAALSASGWGWSEAAGWRPVNPAGAGSGWELTTTTLTHLRSAGVRAAAVLHAG